MFRVMLIDDEEAVRLLLRNSIAWEQHDMEVVGEAASGIEAINTIDEIKPDLALVDISMPFMNGIEFTRLAVERYPNLRIIILTAFDQFEYARQCIGLPVLEYMLKPIVRAEINDTLQRIRPTLAALKAKNTEEEAEIGSQSVQKIRRYIERNYTDPSINLTSVAHQFGFNPSYLSRKFKNETGRSFVEFLTECRMEKAIELAGGNEKMFCTATAVGIPDPNYFGRCFKKYTGRNYSEYTRGQGEGQTAQREDS